MPLPLWNTPLRSECPLLSALTVLWGSGYKEPTLALLYALRKGHVRIRYLLSSATQWKPSPDTDADVLEFPASRTVEIHFWDTEKIHSCCLSYPIYGSLLRRPELRHLPNFKTSGNEKQDENPGRLVPESVFLSLAHIIPGGSVVKNPPANAGEVGSIPWRRKWQLQYCCQENSMDRGAWQAMDREVTRSRTWISD